MVATTVQDALVAARESSDLNALITLIDEPEPSRDESGTLGGVPFLVKDNISTAGIATTCGSDHFLHRIPKNNAGCLESLLNAGAQIIGKCNMDECAYGVTGEFGLNGPVKNPWNTDYISGGSSSGAAAAVAAGIVPFAIGTDTGGSVRIPASLCGVWGFKPTYGFIDSGRIMSLAKSMDTVGILATSSSWLVKTWHAMTGLATQTRRDPKIIWLSGQGMPPISDEVLTLTYDYIKPILAGDHDAPWLTPLTDAYGPLRSGEAYALHEQFVRSAPDKYQARTLDLLHRDAEVRASTYYSADQLRVRMRHDLLQIFKDSEVDFLAMPTTPIPAVPIGTSSVTLRGQELPVHETLLSLAVPWSVLGWPVLSVPAGFIDGLPVGIQIIGKPDSDRELVGFASQIAGLLTTPSTSAR